MIFNKNSKAKQAKITMPVLSENTNFSVVEAYKTIRTNLMFAAQNTGCKRVIITSASPNEGKSINCCNLGITLAQTDSKVLILDCDLRKPTSHKLFKLKGIPGLSEVLAGMNTFDQVLHNSDFPNLDVICGGTVPPNPAELLSSAGMDELLDTLSKEYNYILLDTPPINVVSDALVLSAKTDGVIIIVRQGETTHPELKHALNSLEFAKAKVLGIVLNGVENGRKYGYSKYAYTRYGYGKNRKQYAEYK